MLDREIERGRATQLTWKLAGRGMYQAKEFAQALGAFEHALEMDPTDQEATFELAMALYHLGEVSRAADLYRQAVDEHNNFNALCNLATIIPGDPRATNQSIREVREQFGKQLAACEPLLKRDLPRSQQNSEHLRIGYVSAFFHRENYMKPVWQLINGHDRDRFAIHLFADEVQQSDMAWFKQGPHDRVHLVSEMENDRLARLIQNQQLDILIDLNAYSYPMRLPLFVQRLAPTMAAWFNMYGTSGLPGIDWIIGDPYVAPANEDSLYTEQVARLPQSYLSFSVPYETPPVQPPPCQHGAPLAFGSLITQYKITPNVYDAWSLILTRCPGSTLVLANRALDSECNRNYVLEQFVRRGVAAERVTLLPPAKHGEFLKYYDQIDIALDSFPYNGGTTTTEAIWQGVPVLTTSGDRWASRTSRTLLMNCHLAEFVAESHDDLVERAVHWAHDPQTPTRLGTLRAEMRERLSQSPVCDANSMIRSFERLLVSIGQRD